MRMSKRNLVKSAKAPRSRNGCWTCRNRKIKCDETHPKCTPCSRLGIACDYSRRLNYKDDTARILTKMAKIVDTAGCPVYDEQARAIYQPYAPHRSGEYEDVHENGFVVLSVDDYADDQFSDASTPRPSRYDSDDDEYIGDDRQAEAGPGFANWAAATFPSPPIAADAWYPHRFSLGSSTSDSSDSSLSQASPESSPESFPDSFYDIYQDVTAVESYGLAPYPIPSYPPAAKLDDGPVLDGFYQYYQPLMSGDFMY